MSAQRPFKPRDWDSHPPYLYPDYKSTALRAPRQPLVPLAQSLSELTGPVFGHDSLGPLDHDLTRNAVVDAEPLGERIIVTGRVLDEDGRSVPQTLIEVWQANAAGRYIHSVDQHPAPLDPNFLGAGRCVTDAEGRYRFYTIKPGAYPWGNHPTPGGPTTSTSRSSGPARDPPGDPDVLSRRSAAAPRSDLPGHAGGGAGPPDRRLLARRDRAGLRARLRFDIVLRGPTRPRWRAEPWHQADARPRPSAPTSPTA